MGEQYLEDFAVGQTFGSGRLRIEKEQASRSPQSSTRSPSTSTGWRNRRRWPRREPLTPAGAPGRRIAHRVRGDRGATVKVASGAGADQTPNDHPEPVRRGRAGVCREPGRAAPEMTFALRPPYADFPIRWSFLAFVFIFVVVVVIIARRVSSPHAAVRGGIASTSGLLLSASSLRSTHCLSFSVPSSPLERDRVQIRRPTASQ